MKIGVILGKNKGRLTDCHHSGYYLSGLSKCKEIETMYFNGEPHTAYEWFPIEKSKVQIKTTQEIENMNLDFVIYGYYSYIKDNRIPMAKSPKIQLAMRDSIYQDALKRDIDILSAADIIFKVSTPKDRRVFTTPSAKPYLFKDCNIPQKIADKIYPLMYVGSHPVLYPALPFTNKYKISFTGSITSLERIETVALLKEKYGSDFLGGFCRDTRGPKIARDERGNNFAGIMAAVDVEHTGHKRYMELMRESTISLSPSGFGCNTHRFVDILCMGGVGLVSDVSHIDYGTLGPVEGEHYLAYKNKKELLERVEYLLNNKDKAEEMGNRAMAFMKETYCDNERMAREYILKILK